MTNEPAPAPKRRRLVIDGYTVRTVVRSGGLSALFAAATYALTMAGMWLQAHR